MKDDELFICDCQKCSQGQAQEGKKSGYFFCGGNTTGFAVFMKDLYWYHDLNAKDEDETKPKELLCHGEWLQEIRFTDGRILKVEDTGGSGMHNGIFAHSYIGAR